MLLQITTTINKLPPKKKISSLVTWEIVSSRQFQLGESDVPSTRGK